VRVLDIDRDEERAFFTMELVDGPSLAEVVDAWGPRPVHEAVRIVASVARALHEAHRRGLLHRDVKPGNVMLQTDGTALLTDFGLVTAVREVDARITRTGQVLGTPAYMAPEQAMEDANSLTAKADQYALGAVLYESVCGSPPYDGTAMDVLMGLVTGPPKSIAQRVPSLPHDVVVMIERAMDRDPNRRYDSTLAFAEDLERWLTGKPILARAPTVTYRGRLWLRRHRREITLALSGVLALVVGGVGFRGWSEAQVLAAAQQREASAAGLADLCGELNRARVEKGGRQQGLQRRSGGEIAELADDAHPGHRGFFEVEALGEGVGLKLVEGVEGHGDVAGQGVPVLGGGPRHRRVAEEGVEGANHLGVAQALQGAHSGAEALVDVDAPLGRVAGPLVGDVEGHGGVVFEARR
jgi:hypothetical protein